MGDRIDLLHAAPVHHVPARSRSARVSYTPMVTPVTLRDLSLSETAAGPTMRVTGGHQLQTRLLDGALWRPIGSNGHGLKAEADGAAFKGWLEGRDGFRKLDESFLARCLESTPVLARAPGQRTPPRPYESFDVARQGRIVADTRGMAGAVAEAFVASDLVLLSNYPYRRMDGPFAFYDDHHGIFRLSRHPGSWTTNPTAGRGHMARVDRLDALARFEAVHVERGKSLNLDFEDGPLLGLPATGRDEVDYFAQEAVRLFFNPIANWTRQANPYGAEREADLARYHCLAAIGSIPREDLPALFATFPDLRACLVAANGEKGWLPEGAAKHIRYAEMVAAPILAADPAPIPAADAGSLAAFAP